jgi:hypothetical protein
MDKYKCSKCGDEFETIQLLGSHIFMHAQCGELRLGSIVFKKSWPQKIIDFILWLPYKQLFRLLGAVLIEYVILTHFDIKLTWWEGLMIGSGIGFLIQ